MHSTLRLLPGSFRPLQTAIFCLLALFVLTAMSAAQQQYCPTQTSGPNVVTWHNDADRTGWQCNEGTLTQSKVNSSQFGLLQQWPVAGAVYAQPLAVSGANVTNCSANPCDVVYIATENDLLYAYTTGGGDAWGRKGQYDCDGGTIDHAVLHAFCATAVPGTACATALTELYNSTQNVKKTSIGKDVPFSTPTVFKGQVYMGTKTEVDVFGLCPSGGCPLQ
jgi:hypothetical protein